MWFSTPSLKVWAAGALTPNTNLINQMNNISRSTGRIHSQNMRKILIALINIRGLSRNVDSPHQFS